MVLNRLPYRNVVFYNIVVALSAILLSAWFDHDVGVVINFYVTLALYFGEGLLLASPLWLLPGRWRIIVPVAVWLSALFLWVNVLYCRYWGDLLPWSLIIEPASYNVFVFDAIPGLLKWSDIIYVVLPLFITWLYRRWRISGAPMPSWQKRVMFVAIAVVAYCLGICASVTASYRYYLHSGNPTSLGKVLKEKVSTLSNGRLFEWQGRGLLLYTYIQLARDKGAIDNLSDNQRNQIENYLGEIDNYLTADSAFIHNRNKNLILIVIESLNSWAIGEKINHHSLTPVLDSLLRAEGTVACLDVVPQRRHGGSSDGHFMYNTGLLPISYGSAAMLFADNDYSGQTLTRHFASSVDFIVENGSVWNHRATTKAYGYDRLVEQINVDATPIDSTLFAVAADTIQNLARPFMAEIISLGMHFPFVDKNLASPGWLENAAVSDTHLHNYYKAVYGFDAALGEFLVKIKSEDLYGNSVIVLVSDHDLDVGSRKSDGRIAFIALNTGLTRHIARTVGQIDVYPAIVEIMGFDGWHGLGLSLLDGRNSSAVLYDGTLIGTSGSEIDSLKHRAWPVSDLIVRSDYFRKK